MSNKQFINKLNATYADVRRLDAKKINLKGKPIIGELKDLRGDTATDNDIWPNGVQIDENGNATLYPLGYNKTPIPMQIGFGPDSVFKGNKIIDKNTGEILQWIDSDSLTAFQDGTQMTVLFYCESVETSLNGIPDNANLIFDVRKEFKVDMLNTNGSLEITNTSEGLTPSITLNAPKLGYLKVTKSISEFNGDLSSLTDGRSMFSGCTSLASFNGNLSNLALGLNMFNGCTSLSSFDSDLSSLTSGNDMFRGCTNLTSFSGDLSSLTNGNNMFTDCTKLTSFSGNLSSLTSGYLMFQWTSLTSFNGDLSRLTNGYLMFYLCTSLTSFNGDLSSLTTGKDMFGNCSNLTSFSSNLSSLTNGKDMFNKAKLDASSLANIIHTINTPATNGTITIGLGIDDTDEARQALAEAIWCKDWDDINQEFANKNWTVTWQFNGAPTA